MRWADTTPSPKTCDVGWELTRFEPRMHAARAGLRERLRCDTCDACYQLVGKVGHPPAAPVDVLALLLLQDVVALGRRALVCRALGDGAAVAGIAVRLALVPWQLAQVILEELVASRPVLIALQAGWQRGRAKQVTDNTLG
jgi:hypothetical protein